MALAERRAERATMVTPLILVVDDDRHIARLLGHMLLHTGYRVEIVHDGEQALAQLRRLHPSIMFLDVMMPTMDGFQVCEQLRRDPAIADTYVIMLTALGQKLDRDRAAKSGADEYLVKPFSPSAVARHVLALLPLVESTPLLQPAS